MFVRLLSTFLYGIDECLLQAEKEKAKSKEYEHKYIEASVELKSLTKEVADLKKECKHFQDLSEKYFRELKNKEKELLNNELDKIHSTKTTDEDFSQIETVIL